MKDKMKCLTAIEYLKKTYKNDKSFYARKAVLCKDGFVISIQGGTDGHYCLPRMHCNIYDNVELGFPSKRENLIMEYIEDNENPTETVYGYVPIEIVEKVIKKHGGIVGTVKLTQELNK